MSNNNRSRRRNPRNSRNQLTGGTGDVNPQFQSFTLTQSAADTTTSSQIVLAIDRLRSTGNRVGVVEVLSVSFDWRTPLTAATASNLTAAITSKSFGTTKVQFSEPTLIAYYHESQGAVATPYSYPVWFNLTDSAGHGILVATDSIFFQVSSTTTGLTNVVDAKIEYRYKNVALQEYVGLVVAAQQ